MTHPTRPEEVPRRRRPADPDIGELSPEAMRQVLHDLRVHQIELEMQNEELLRTQEQLETARARYFDLYDLAPVGYLTLNKAGSILEANFTAAALLGRERTALTGQPLTRFILPADQDIYYRHRKSLVETGARQVSELRMVRNDGAHCWVRVEATSATDPSGAVVFRVVLSDVTARKRAEETLKASEARFRTLYDKSHDALMTLVPPNFRFTSANPAALAMFGASDETDFLSRAPSEYSPERQPDGSASAVKAAAMMETAMGQGSHFYEWTFRRMSGEEFSATVFLTRLEVDGLPQLHAAVRDETEVKKLHAMLGQQDRLASMGMLAASVAHEINNPLTSVLYNIETLAEWLPKLDAALERCAPFVQAEFGEDRFAEIVGEDAPLLEPSSLKDAAERAREALAGARRIRTIAKAMGTFSRVESTKRAWVDLNYAIECATTMALNDIKFRARLVVDFGRLPPVWASEGKLSQVFLNLLINAAHAIDEGDAEHSFVRIRTWAEGDGVFAEVKDTGKGISTENLGRIFDPFFTTKPVGVGSGLGLSICKNIIAEFGGDIRIESELGRGTRVLVRLPIRARGTEPPDDASESEVPGIPGARGRILVVDDEPGIRMMMARRLGRAHDVVTAASGEEARAILERDEAFDVILCDLMMPAMTGMDLHAWLAAGNPTLANRVVFVTGGAFTPKAAEYIARVGNTLLEKPFDPARLDRIVSETIAVARPRDRWAAGG